MTGGSVILQRKFLRGKIINKAFQAFNIGGGSKGIRKQPPADLRA